MGKLRNLLRWPRKEVVEHHIEVALWRKVLGSPGELRRRCALRPGRTKGNQVIDAAADMFLFRALIDDEVEFTDRAFPILCSGQDVAECGNSADLARRPALGDGGSNALVDAVLRDFRGGSHCHNRLTHR